MSNSFADLTWNAELGWWLGNATITPNHQINLHVQAANTPAALCAVLESVVPRWEQLQAGEPSIRATVADQMCVAHNDACAVEDEVTTEQFADRLRLLSILFESAGSVELCYDDGGLFGGHSILVPISAAGQVGEATEAG